jgi:hypothetical protein
MGFHSVTERPDLVSRVMPPTNTMAKIWRRRDDRRDYNRRPGRARRGGEGKGFAHGIRRHLSAAKFLAQAERTQSLAFARYPYCSVK